jgi:hypothetical protein
VEAKKSFSLIEIGLCLRYLVESRQGESVKGALKVINRLERTLVAAEFDVSVSGMNLLGPVKEKLKTKSDGEDDEQLDKELAKELAEISFALERIVFAEAQTKQIYVLPKRRFDSNFLLSNPAKFLRPGSFECMSVIAQADFTSACRCLLFGESTAAAFHILRATEEMLKQYYFHHRRKERLPKPMWAAMLTQLRAKKTNKPSSVLLDSLDMIRDAYRNPTQHPQATYDVESAQDLFGLCLDVISKMTAELQGK